MTDLPFSQAAENNKDPILDVLRVALGDCRSVLEVGSGTGQHAVWFAGHLPHLSWQSSEQQQNLQELNLRLGVEAPVNVRDALVLDVADAPWPVEKMDAVFAANCVHIMSWSHVEKMFAGLAGVLNEGGILILYGPYKYKGNFTSDSNARFEQWLKGRDSKSGIRDFEKVDALANEIGLTLQKDHPMPANNQCLIWQKNR
ncbi:MAG: class I SAM-dependent methyltransferase [Hyphomicrobiaceae bacterium]|nr:class I SAM-dependent methyltransferase [Hyphomicrobiaceae bacterium]